MTLFPVSVCFVVLLTGSTGSAFRGTKPTKNTHQSSRSSPTASSSDLLLGSGSSSSSASSSFREDLGIKLTWEAEVRDCVRSRFLQQARGDRAGAEKNRRPFMVSIVGLPGSGKSTSTAILADLLGKEEEDEHGIGGCCMTMPFDGYHLPLAELRRRPDADDAVWRRGAPHTFDPSSLARDLRRIRYGTESLVEVPGFDHAQGDPELGAHKFCRDQHKIVLCEGLYLHHDRDGWQGLSDYFDLKVHVDADLEVCLDRLRVRNRSIPGYSPQEIDGRVDAVDRVNALTVMESAGRADLVVKSAAW